MRRRDHHAADGSAVSGVRIGVEDQVGDAGSHARVHRLLEAGLVEVVADRIGSDHGDRLPGIVRERHEAEGFVGFVYVVHECLLGISLKLSGNEVIEPRYCKEEDH